MEFADVFTPMQTADGKFRDELYVFDRLHMTAAGYMIWSDVLSPLVKNAILKR